MHIAIEIKFLHAKIFHGCKKLKSGATKLEALYFPPNVLIPVPAPLHYSRHYNKLNFKPPFCSTQAYSSSFFPSVISLWNSLPDEAKTSSSLSSFRQIISLLSSQN